VATCIVMTKRGRFKTLFVTTAFLVCLLISIGHGFTATTSKGALEKNVRENIKNKYWQLPLRFEANQGQTDSRVKFVSRGPGYNLFLTQEEAVFSLWADKAALPNVNAKKVNNLKTQRRSALFSIQFMGSNQSIQPKGVEELPIKTNYLIGNDPRNWHSDIPTYAKVKVEGLYSGIDVLYYGNQHQLEFDFVIRPGTDYKSIRIKFKNVNQLRTDSEGNLILGVHGGKVLLKKPIVYQLVDGKKHNVRGCYRLHAKDLVGFHVASYDSKIPLVIDPVLNYSTYLGGNFDDLGNGIAVDVFGSAYVVGATQSTNFPTTAGAFQESPSSFRDAFVTKLSSEGTTVVYSTYLGGNADDFGSDVAVDGSGNAYVVGDTESIDFPTTVGAFQESPSSFRDAFVTKLNADGSTLVYSTYLGGDDIEFGKGLALDSSGNAYVTGATQSANFPTTTGAFQEIRQSSRDAFVTKLNTDGSDLVYSTYLGGTNNQDLGTSIAVDSAGNAYVTGSTQSTTFPTTPDAFNTSRNSFQDAFVSKLNTDGSDLLYSTYLGGNADDVGNSIVVGSSGRAYIAGSTQSTDFPTTVGTFDRTSNSLNDVFVTKLETDGSDLVYSTYLGGNSDDFGYGIAVDSSGNAYVIGATRSTDFPTQDPLQATLISLQDVFVTNLNADGSALVYSTYLGGDFNDLGNDIAVDTSGNAYITGTTESTNFPTKDAFQPEQSSLRDAFVAKINPSGGAILYSTYIGGTGDDSSNSIAVDTAGNAYIVGTTESDNFPTQDPLFPNRSGASDVFVSKLDPFGDTFIYSTYLGGTGDDFGNYIAVDSSGNAYVTGTTNSNNFPTTAGSFRTTPFGNNDAFVTKLNPTGSAPLVYSTYLGGTADDLGNGIAVDSSSNTYIAGTTLSDDFPVRNPLQATRSGDSDAFVTKLNSTGTAPLVYSTYLGGSMDDSGNSIAVDISGNAYIAGTTESNNFPVSNAFQANLGGGTDGFITKVDAAGDTLVYSSYLGGNLDDFGNDVALDGLGNAFVAGTTLSNNFPTKSVQGTLGGGSDGFVTKIQEAEGSGSTTGGSGGGGGGGCFIGSAAYNSHVNTQVELDHLAVAILIGFTSILIMIIAFFLLRRLRLQGVVFNMSRVKRK
jgi:hypothetical protein